MLLAWRSFALAPREISQLDYERFVVYLIERWKLIKTLSSLYDGEDEILKFYCLEDDNKSWSLGRWREDMEVAHLASVSRKTMKVFVERLSKMLSEKAFYGRNFISALLSRVHSKLSLPEVSSNWISRRKCKRRESKSPCRKLKEHFCPINHAAAFLTLSFMIEETGEKEGKRSGSCWKLRPPSTRLTNKSQLSIHNENFSFQD